MLYNPANKRERVLCAPSSPALVDALRTRGVPLSVGRAIVATVEPHQQVVLDAIRELGLELQVIFNKGAVMVLPSGVNKATGLLAALDDLCMSPHDVVGVGDAENDHAFLEICELSVAVRNAVPALRDRVDLLTEGARGDGVQELIDRLLAAGPDAALSPQRHWLAIGSAPDRAVTIDPHGPNILISGAAGCRHRAAVDADDDAARTAGGTALSILPGRFRGQLRVVSAGDSGRHAADGAGHRRGDRSAAASRPERHRVAGRRGGGRSTEVLRLSAARIQELRKKTGHPHWTVLDEAHHLLPADSGAAAAPALRRPTNLAMVTVAPDLISPLALDEIDVFIAVGEVTEALTAILTRRGLHASPQADRRREWR